MVHRIYILYLQCGYFNFLLFLHEELNISEHNYIEIMRKLSYHNQGHIKYLFTQQTEKKFSFTFFFYFFLFNFFSLQKIHLNAKKVTLHMRKKQQCKVT